MKGNYLGKCNRTACKNTGAFWWNVSTQAYYCQPCAFEISRVNPPGLFERHEPQEPNTPYADKLIAFQKVLMELTYAEREMTRMDISEPIRERARQAHVEAMRLYNNLLNKLQNNSIEP